LSENDQNNNLINGFSALQRAENSSIFGLPVWS